MTELRTETAPFDAADYLASPEDEIAYLEAAFEDGSPNVIAAAIGAVVRARGATDTARRAGVSRETLYKAFAPDGNPTLTTMLGVLKAMDVELRPRPIGNIIRTAQAT